MNKKNVDEAISVVVPVRNSATTVLGTLKSIEKQTYPVKEIIVIDNASEDDSIFLVKQFANKSNLKIKVITRKKNKGLGESYNEGVKKAKSALVVLMHSDCTLPTKKELTKLIEPMKNSDVVATYPTIILAEKVWESYDFWEKYFFARIVGKRIAGFATKFDCVRKNIFEQVSGVDIKNYGVGNEDGDLHDKIRKIGVVAKSEAVVMHLHFIGEGYSFKKMLVKTRGYSRTYGRILRVKGLSLHSGLIFLIKPMIAILPWISFFHFAGILLLFAFSLLYTKKMFTTQSTISDGRILLVPFVNIFILYYEVFWMIEGYFFGKNKIE